MQSLPAVPVITSLFDVPMMTLVPAGQQVASSPSWVVTDCWAVTTLPSASVHFHVTTVVSSGRIAGALCENVTGPHALASGGGTRTPALHDVTVTGGSMPTTGGAVHTPSSRRRSSRCERSGRQVGRVDVAPALHEHARSLLPRDRVGRAPARAEISRGDGRQRAPRRAALEQAPGPDVDREVGLDRVVAVVARDQIVQAREVLRDSPATPPSRQAPRPPRPSRSASPRDPRCAAGGECNSARPARTPAGGPRARA